MYNIVHSERKIIKMKQIIIIKKTTKPLHCSIEIVLLVLEGKKKKAKPQAHLRTNPACNCFAEINTLLYFGEGMLRICLSIFSG